jgi:hydroxyacylglutathione hydrolase
MLNIHSFTFNPFQENTWLLWSAGRNCIIIDPGCYGGDEEKMLASFIDQHQLKPVRLINTHCHIDHVLGNPFVFRTWGLRPEIHYLEQAMYDAVPQYGEMWGIRSDEQPETLQSLIPDEFIELDGNKLKILFTPGHSPGEICLYAENDHLLIAGDVLFRESIGRTDLPGGSFPQLEKSIREKLYILPEQTMVHPGHGPSSTIGHEKKHNPFVKS